MKTRSGIRLLAGMFTASVILLGSHYYYSIHHVPLTDAEQDFSVASGESFGQVSARLESAGLLAYPFYWQLHARLLRQTRNLTAGDYRIFPADTLDTLLHKFIQHDVVLQSFTIIEGWTAEQILQAMRDNPTIRMDSIDQKEIARQIGIPEGQALEGWLYPDTYQFSNMTSSIKIFAKAYEKMVKKLEKYWITADRGLLPLKTPYQLLILASIVEKEAALNEEKQRIAGVFVARLQRGMRLQSDPTVIYGMGDKFDGNLRRKDLHTDTVYNTYTRSGLPPTPISMPGEHSLHAAAEPELTGDLYFVAKGDRSHVFSKTYKEHQKAVTLYQLAR